MHLSYNQRIRREMRPRSLYEAVGLAIDRFLGCEQVPYDPQGMHVFIVESREPSTEHRLTRKMFDVCPPLRSLDQSYQPSIVARACISRRGASWTRREHQSH